MAELRLKRLSPIALLNILLSLDMMVEEIGGSELRFHIRTGGLQIRDGQERIRI